MPRIVVTSPSFSHNAQLRDELLVVFPSARFCKSESILTGEKLLDLIGDADGAIIGMEIIDDALLAAKPGLQIVAKYGVGLDNLDLVACRQRGVKVGWTGGVNAGSVAEMTLCFMLGLPHNMFRTAALLRGGEWMKRGGVMLRGRSIGIIGIGHIGREVIRLLQPFGCHILANDIEDRSEFCAQYGATPCDKPTLFSQADIVSLHVPLTPETQHLINRDTLAAMRPGSFLLNTSRGAVVSQEALHAALASGHLGGAALDVYEREPPSDLNFLALPGLTATPHIGGNAQEAVLAMGRSAISWLQKHFSCA